MSQKLKDLKALTDILEGPRDKNIDVDVVFALTKTVNEIVSQAQIELKAAIEALRTTQKELDAAKQEIIFLKEDIKATIDRLTIDRLMP